MDFSQFYSKHFNEVYKYAFQKLNDKEDATDFTQDMFMKILSNWKNIDTSKASHRTYLFNVVKNGLIDRFKKKNLGMKCEIADSQFEDSDGPRTGSVTLVSNSNPEWESITNEYISNFKKELLSLPTKHKRIATMFFVYGRSVPDISERLGIPTGTITPSIKKSRSIFQALWEK